MPASRYSYYAAYARYADADADIIYDAMLCHAVDIT